MFFNDILNVVSAAKNSYYILPLYKNETDVLCRISKETDECKPLIRRYETVGQTTISLFQTKRRITLVVLCSEIYLFLYKCVYLSVSNWHLPIIREFRRIWGLWTPDFPMEMNILMQNQSCFLLACKYVLIVFGIRICRIKTNCV